MGRRNKLLLTPAHLFPIRSIVKLQFQPSIEPAGHSTSILLFSVLVTCQATGALTCAIDLEQL
jgi:hypothetical protein